jgi:hypothetical protein
MSTASFAAKAIVNGPHTVAPPSFDGQGWLVVINLAWFTAGFVLFAMLAVSASRDLWRCRRLDMIDHPVTVLRIATLLLGVAGTIRFGAEAATLWGWNPRDPSATALLLVAKRMLDPIAATFGLAAIALLYLSKGSMEEQLRRRPFPVRLWASLPMLKRPAAVVALSLVAAAGMVLTR